MSKPAKTAPQGGTIALNRRARHDYALEERFEAGIALEGWEVKSLRAGKAQLVDAYVLLKEGEAFLLGALITPLGTASTHITPDPTRTRKLLLNRRELNQLIGAVTQKGYTCIPTALYWKGNHVKCEVALAKGKKLYDKRASEKERDWAREKERVLRHTTR
ncbi:MAG: SsrA-binding protein SmpB [Pseudomonadales bacterium]|jgi:SsrA-binding protein|nr:SsrA-binding protein SmpB [Pseudomonadales bacterium]MCC6528953.1 SsrA-binding protein SmpB [Pseudomonadales bacterium]MCP5332983.1 SsrA-binding protein SmpB [Pseudomonadales bacterium]HMU91041.1 SsrA-binding protein SmpB [Pseudomonadales bacterium]HMW15902.1 SsrA-binding protein SmpB [Pseudomonadales bacterium]